jgi:hypothetical protein
MKTHIISDKLKATVNRMYNGAERDRVIKDLESGKIVYKGGAKLKADKIEKPEKVETSAPARPVKNEDEAK